MCIGLKLLGHDGNGTVILGIIQYKNAMIYTVKGIIADTRIAMNRDPKAPPLFDSEPFTLQLDDIIKSNILDGVRKTHIEAALSCIDCGRNFDPDANEYASGLHFDENNAGWMLLPSDFMRLLTFKMDDWETPVFETIDATSPLYALQRSRYSGLRGSPQRPVCALVARAEGLALEFYSCRSNRAKISKAIYLPFPSIDENEGVEISEQCYHAAIMEIAKLTKETLSIKSH